MGVHPVLAVSLRAREAERDGIGRALGPAPSHHILRLRCRDAAVRAERARRSSPPRADRNDIDMGVHPVLAVSLRAREAERDGIGRALGPAPSIIFCGCGAGTRPFERSELGGLRRRERIATTSTWLSVVFSLRFFRPSLFLDLGVGRPSGRRGARHENKAIVNQSPLLRLFYIESQFQRTATRRQLDCVGTL